MNIISRAIFRISIFIVISIFGIRLTSAFFSDSASSTTNTFSASTVFPTGAIIPTPENIANHIVISEVQINGGSSQADHDFIELYNPTNTPFDLNNHRLVIRTGNASADTNIKSWSSPTVVPSHGYYLWANNGDATSPFIALADTTTRVYLTSSNSIALRSGNLNTGSIVDSLSWNSGSTLGEGTPYSPNPGGDESIERKAVATSTAITLGVGGADEFKGNGYDTDNNINDFILKTSPQPQNSSSPTESL